MRADRWYGIALSGFSQLGVAVPVFWVGVIVVWVFALQLGCFHPADSPATTGRILPTRCGRSCCR